MALCANARAAAPLTQGQRASSSVGPSEPEKGGRVEIGAVAAEFGPWCALLLASTRASRTDARPRSSRARRDGGEGLGVLAEFGAPATAGAADTLLPLRGGLFMMATSLRRAYDSRSWVGLGSLASDGPLGCGPGASGFVA